MGAVAAVVYLLTVIVFIPFPFYKELVAETSGGGNRDVMLELHDVENGRVLHRFPHSKVSSSFSSPTPSSSYLLAQCYTCCLSSCDLLHMSLPPIDYLSKIPLITPVPYTLPGPCPMTPFLISPTASILPLRPPLPPLNHHPRPHRRPLRHPLAPQILPPRPRLHPDAHSLPRRLRRHHRHRPALPLPLPALPRPLYPLPRPITQLLLLFL